MRTHIISEDEFARFAAGLASPAGIASLRAGQVSRRLLLLRTIAEDARSSRLDTAYTLLSEIQSHAPDAVAAVFDSPAFGTWSALTLQALRAKNHDTAEVLTGQLGVFAAVTENVEFSPLPANGALPMSSASSSGPPADTPRRARCRRC
jgi:HEXXH motif-containing protein